MTSKGRNRMTATRIAMRMGTRIVARMRIKTRVGTTVRLETKTMKRMVIRIQMMARIRVTKIGDENQDEENEANFLVTKTSTASYVNRLINTII